MFRPYPYQQECLRKIEKARSQGRNRALVVMAGGLGKTVTAALDVKQWLMHRSSVKVLYVCHQDDILTQAHTTFVYQ